MELIRGQLWYVLASFFMGVLSLFLYDFILALRVPLRHRRLWILLEDWLFWALASLLVFQMIFALNDGILRSFFVLAFILGMIVYRRAAKKRVQHAICFIFSWISRPYVWFLKKIRQWYKKSLKT